MAAEDILKYLNLYVDGRGYFGKITDYNPPDLSLTTDDFRGGGMDAPIDLDMGMEKLTFSFVLISYDEDVRALFGVKTGGGVQFTAKGSLEDEMTGETIPETHNMQGKITSLARGTWGSGNTPSLTISVSLHYYREMHGERVIHEFDVINMKRIVDGVDQLAEHRANIGL